MVDTLEHLEKGGRIGGARALLGSLLSIKPVVTLINGRVEEESKQRTRSRSLRYLADKAKSSPPISRLAVCNGAAPDIDEFLAMLEGVPTDHPLVVTDLGPVVGTHTGPGTIGLCLVIAGLSRRGPNRPVPAGHRVERTILAAWIRSPTRPLPAFPAPTRSATFPPGAPTGSTPWSNCCGTGPSVRSPWPPGPWSSGSSSSPPPW